MINNVGSVQKDTHLRKLEKYNNLISCICISDTEEIPAAYHTIGHTIGRSNKAAYGLRRSKSSDWEKKIQFNFITIYCSF